jgi:hypothetical protein
LSRFIAVLAALVVLAVVPAAASAASPPAQRKVTVTVKIKRFVADASGVSALGTASAVVGPRTTRRQVTLSVSKTTNCAILALNLQNLQLQLLGLNLVASPINLTITGDPTRTLGGLFCKLSRGIDLGKLTATKAAAASLNRSLKGRPMKALAVNTKIYATTRQAGATSCQVLNLVLGPLHLDLLGLIVDLYGADRTKPVTVNVSADPNAGILGSVFCKLASGQAVQ